MDANLRCKVFPGQFSSELSVEGVQADGEQFSLFAPAKYVTSDEPVTRDRSVEGWLQGLGLGRSGGEGPGPACPASRSRAACS